MRVLVACEESQTITKEFRALGHEAYSCDILDCSGGHPEWHLKGDVFSFVDRDWDLMIAHPPCTYLSVSGARWLENPVSVISTLIRKPDQIIQPWMFGDEATKTTCLWLKNLPKLEPTNIVGKGERTIFKSGKSHPKWYADALANAKTAAERRTLRSKTFTGIAKAIAQQWGQF